MSRTVTAFEDHSLEPEQREQVYVHDVYDQIASHFSQTRYKPWPIISQFLASLPSGSLGLDSGCGNGKYLPLDQGGKVMTVGLDRSIRLLEIAQKAGYTTSFDREVIRGDVLDNIWRAGAFDYAISIATIHHLSTAVRRREAIKTLLRCLNPKHGRLMIYVWAIEQDPLSKRVIPTSEDELPDGRDTLVPWVMTKTSKSGSTLGEDTKALDNVGSQTSRNGSTNPAETFHRYYHFFAKNELRELAQSAATELGLHIGPRLASASELEATGDLEILRGVEIVNEGWERSNLYIEMRLWEMQRKGL